MTAGGKQSNSPASASLIERDGQATVAQLRSACPSSLRRSFRGRYLRASGKRSSENQSSRSIPTRCPEANRSAATAIADSECAIARSKLRDLAAVARGPTARPSCHQLQYPVTRYSQCANFEISLDGRYPKAGKRDRWVASITGTNRKSTLADRFVFAPCSLGRTRLRALPPEGQRQRVRRLLEHPWVLTKRATRENDHLLKHAWESMLQRIRT